MKGYAFIFSITGILLFIASGLFNILAIKTITLKIDDLLLNLSATMFSIALLTFIYKMIGEEPAIKLLKDLMSMLEASKKLNQLGIKDLNGKRSEFNIAEIHSNFSVGKSAIIMSRNISAIKHARVKELFITMLNSNKRIRILIGENATQKADLKAFQNNLNSSQKKLFEVKETNHITCTMYGNDRMIYATFPLHKFSGDESPSLMCVNIENKDSVFSIFAKEFDYVWETNSDYL